MASNPLMAVANRSAIHAVMTGLAWSSVVTMGVGLASSERSWAQSVPGVPMQLAQAQPTQRLPEAVERRVLQDAARRSQVPVNQLRIGQVTEQVFSNTCVFEFGDRCLTLNEPIAGWTVVVPVKGVPWTYHVDRTTNHLILDPRIVAQLPTNPTPNPMPGAYIDAVIADAARRANVAPGTLRVLQTKPMTFGNPCLFHFGEFCTKELNPIEGYEVVLQVKNQPWKYHVDRPGRRVVLDPKISKPTAVTLPRNLQTRILTDAAQRSGLPAASLQITQATQRTFGNACEFGFGEICPMIYQPVEGWEAAVKVGAQTWTYRIDRTGTQLVLDPKVSPTVGRLPAAVERAVLQNAKAWTAEPTVKIVSAKAQTWGNDCAFNFGRICPANYQPLTGWAVQVNAGGLDWTYHTNADGSQVVMDRRTVLPSPVATAIAQDIAKRHGPQVKLDTLRFLEVKETTERVCFLFSCRNEPGYLAIASNGTQQWGYRTDAQGRKVMPMSITQIRQTQDALTGQR